MFAFAGGKIRQVVPVIWCQYPRESSSHLHNELLNCNSRSLCRTMSTTSYCTRWTLHKTLAICIMNSSTCTPLQFKVFQLSLQHFIVQSEHYTKPLRCATHCNVTMRRASSSRSHLYNQLLSWGSGAQQVEIFTIMETDHRSTRIVHT